MSSFQHRPIGIGIVTYNNLELLQKCFPSWRAPANCELMIFDNGSQPELVHWLKARDIDRLVLSTRNMGLCYARNRILEYFRGRAEFVLLADSDVRFHNGMIEDMHARIVADQSIGFVGFAQANKRFPVSAQGEVEEITGECQLTRMQMWLEIGLYPECLQYYSGDSWKSTIANMHGWKTVLVSGKTGYDHFQHGSHVNPGVVEAMERDTAIWQRKERNFINYWQTRLLRGHGEHFRPAAPT